MIQLLLGTFGLAALFAFQNCSPDSTNAIEDTYLMDSSSPAVQTAVLKEKPIKADDFKIHLKTKFVSNKDFGLSSENSAKQ